MKDPIFVRSAHEYNSYRDFWNLVELSEFPQRKIEHTNLDEDEIFIIVPFGGEARDHIRYRKSILKGPQKAKYVLWNIERPDSDLPFSEENVRKFSDWVFEYVDEIWVSDRYFQKLDPRTKFVVLGSHPKMGNPVHDVPEYDFAHLSHVTYRRWAMFDKLKNFKVAPVGWGEEKDRILRKSHAMINIHQTPVPIGEPLRFALAAGYGLPLFSEICSDPWPLREGREILMAPYEEFPSKIREWFSRNDLASIGEALRYRLTEEWTFRKGVEEAISK